MPLDIRQSRIDLPQLFPLHPFQLRVLRITADHIEIVAVRKTLRSNQLSERKDFIEIIASDNGIDIHDEPLPEWPLQSSQHLRAFQRLFEIARNAAHEIVRFAEPVQGDVDVQVEAWILRKTMLRNFKYAVRF